MARRRTPPDDSFTDVHFVRTYIGHRFEQLNSDGPVGEESRLGRAERDAILEFVKERQGTVGELRVRTYLAWLPLACARLGGQFLDPGREAPARFNEVFPTTSYARASRTTVAQCLASFWRWRFARMGKEYPSWLRIKFEKWKPVSGASDMLTREDVASIVEHAQNFRDRAWIWTLFNSGCRPGEIYQLRVGDVVPHDEGYIELRVNREKGSAPEPAPIYEDAVPALLAWLNAHPRREDPKAPLWVDLGGKRGGKAATYRAMYKALESAARRSKIAKPVTAYALRRSRLTILAKDPAVSTSILEKVAGWVPGSNVARHYVHLSGKDVIGALNARYGVKTVGSGGRTEVPRTPSKCGRCKTINPAGASFCSTCGGPLSLPAVKQIEEARGAEERLAELLNRPEAVEFLAKLLAENGGDARVRHSGGSGSKSAVAESGVPGPETHSPGARSPSLQRVVSLAEAERLIGSGYEFVAPLGSDRAILRSPGGRAGDGDNTT
ncbi:MAG: site-specific integrase [Thermoplasmata archaeon]|nr:site-specific integrase [Thermoplasmata archaeon]